MSVFKAHGLGNDYLVWEGASPLGVEAVRALCDRHRGVGGDGLLEPLPSDRATAAVRIWNPDGSVAEKSGNGLRIFAWWLREFRDAPERLTVACAAELVECRVEGTTVAVEMGAAAVRPLELQVDGVALGAFGVRIGNPHCVIFREEADLDGLPWRRWGEVLERDPAFPNRTNVQVARVVGAGALELRVWERGAGPTLASGSSACAVAAAAVATGRVAAGQLEVEMPGGALSITVRPDHTVRMRGPVAPIGRIELDARFLAQLTTGTSPSDGGTASASPGPPHGSDPSRP